MSEFVQMLSPDKLLPFEKHPFQVREDESLKELMESIRRTTHSPDQPAALTRRIRATYQKLSPFRLGTGRLSSNDPSGQVEGRGEGGPNSFSER